MESKASSPTRQIGVFVQKIEQFLETKQKECCCRSLSGMIKFDIPAILVVLLENSEKSNRFKQMKVERAIKLFRIPIFVKFSLFFFQSTGNELNYLSEINSQSDLLMEEDGQYDSPFLKFLFPFS